MSLISRVRTLVLSAWSGDKRRRSRIWGPVSDSVSQIQHLEQRLLMSSENGDGQDPISGTTGSISCFADNPGGADIGGSDLGGADTGGGTGSGGGTGDSGCEVTIETLDDQMLEGPYTKSRLDEGVLRLTRTGSTELPLKVKLELTGSATPLLDYRISNMERDLLDPEPSPGDETPHAIVTIPAGRTSLDFKLISSSDHQFEIPETIQLRVVPAMQGGYAPAAPDTAGLLLTDATADIDLSFSATNLNWLDDKQEDKNGSMIQRNTDFDAAQYDCDMRFYDAVNRLAIDEDDVVRMKIRSYIKPQHDLADRGRMQFSLSGDLSTLRLYRYQKGRNGAPAGWVHFDSARQIELDEGEEMDFRVEGMRTAIDRLTVNWETVNQPRVGDYFDSVNYICWDVDLDIDSNNNSALKKPEQSDWEEYLEDHSYGIGKLLYPTRKDQAPPETDPNFGNRVGFVPLPYSTSPTPVGTQVSFSPPDVPGKSGVIRLWRKTADKLSELNAKPIEEGGDVITPGRVYNVNDIGNAGVVWMEALVSMNKHSELDGAEGGAPVDKLQYSVFLSNTSEEKPLMIWTDTVQYMVNEHDDTFYPNLQFDKRQRYWSAGVEHTGVVVRDSLISEGVYGLKDLPQFGQQKLREGELRPFNLPVKVYDALITSELAKGGLGVAVYRDFLSETGKDYVLAFAGTQADVEDVITDVVQGIGLSGAEWKSGAPIEIQYSTATKISDSLSASFKERNLKIRATGHSLGGGLASAASVASSNLQMPANTFNAAGLHKNTITTRVEGVLDPAWPITPNAFDRFDRERSGSGIVRAFSTKYDPLTFFQENIVRYEPLGFVPKAIGTPVRLHSPYNESVESGLPDIVHAIESFPRRFALEPYSIWLARFTIWINRTFDSAFVIPKMLPHHGIHAVEWGLMVQMNYVPVTKKVFDIFGKEEPGK